MGFFGGMMNVLGKRVGEEILNKMDEFREEEKRAQAEREAKIGKRATLIANKTYCDENGDTVPKALVNLPIAFKITGVREEKFVLKGKNNGKEYILLLDEEEIKKIG